MKMLSILALAICLVATPGAIAGTQDGPSARCNGHMCPIARAATDVGHQVVTALPLVHVEAGEFLS